jgi:hypothetical protein
MAKFFAVLFSDMHVHVVSGNCVPDSSQFSVCMEILTPGWSLAGI